MRANAYIFLRGAGFVGRHHGASGCDVCMCVFAEPLKGVRSALLESEGERQLGWIMVLPCICGAGKRKGGRLAAGTDLWVLCVCVWCECLPGIFDLRKGQWFSSVGLVRREESGT